MKLVYYRTYKCTKLWIILTWTDTAKISNLEDRRKQSNLATAAQPRNSSKTRNGYRADPVGPPLTHQNLGNLPNTELVLSERAAAPFRKKGRKSRKRVVQLGKCVAVNVQVPCPGLTFHSVATTNHLHSSSPSSGLFGVHYTQMFDCAFKIHDRWSSVKCKNSLISFDYLYCIANGHPVNARWICILMAVDWLLLSPLLDVDEDTQRDVKTLSGNARELVSNSID